MSEACRCWTAARRPLHRATSLEWTRLALTMCVESIGGELRSATRAGGPGQLSEVREDDAAALEQHQVRTKRLVRRARRRVRSPQPPSAFVARDTSARGTHLVRVSRARAGGEESWTRRKELEARRGGREKVLASRAQLPRRVSLRATLVSPRLLIVPRIVERQRLHRLKVVADLARTDLDFSSRPPGLERSLRFSSSLERKQSDGSLHNTDLERKS